jgi:hypothetical protein
VVEEGKSTLEEVLRVTHMETKSTIRAEKAARKPAAGSPSQGLPAPEPVMA